MTVEPTAVEPPAPAAPRQNRVTPFGDIVAVPQRGSWLGNRGILHRGDEVVRFHRSDMWIVCALRRGDHRLEQWSPHSYTVLFFHDEAVALAAGHRPCALCRRADYNRYRQAWLAASTQPTSRPVARASLPLAAQLDRQLHAERLVRESHRRRLHPMPWTTLPVGAFVAVAGQPNLVLADRIVPWTTAGYLPPALRPSTGEAEVITPPSSVQAMRFGYCPQLDSAATSH